MVLNACPCLCRCLVQMLERLIIFCLQYMFPVMVLAVSTCEPHCCLSSRMASAATAAATQFEPQAALHGAARLRTPSPAQQDLQTSAAAVLWCTITTCNVARNSGSRLIPTHAAAALTAHQGRPPGTAPTQLLCLVACSDPHTHVEQVPGRHYGNCVAEQLCKEQPNGPYYGQLGARGHYTLVRREGLAAVVSRSHATADGSLLQ